MSIQVTGIQTDILIASIFWLHFFFYMYFNSCLNDVLFKPKHVTRERLTIIRVYRLYLKLLLSSENFLDRLMIVQLVKKLIFFKITIIAIVKCIHSTILCLTENPFFIHAQTHQGGTLLLPSTASHKSR